MLMKDLNEIIRNNPKVDKKLLNNGLIKINELRKFGIHKSGFNLDIPYRKQLKFADNNELSLKY